MSEERWSIFVCGKCGALQVYDCTCAENDPQAREQEIEVVNAKDYKALASQVEALEAERDAMKAVAEESAGNKYLAACYCEEKEEAEAERDKLREELKPLTCRELQTFKREENR